MKPIKSILSAVLIGALASLATPAISEEFTIGYSQFWGTNPFLITMTDGARKAISEWEAKGVNVDLIVTNGGDTDPTKQVADVEDLYAQGVDGLIMFPGDSSILAKPVKDLYNPSAKPVVITDVGLNSGVVETFIVTDNYKGGQMAAEILAGALPPGAKVVSFNHSPGIQALVDRQRGFEDRARELGLSVQPEISLTLSLENGRRAMEDALTSMPDLAGAYSGNQVIALGAASALASSNRTDVKLVTFDIDPVSYAAIKDGAIQGAVVQDPFRMGYEGMNAVLTKLTGGVPEPKLEILPVKLTRENAADFAQNPQIAGSN
ncbi:substrate-binding domain-containing protein [Mesorhizobium sp. KR9-304]|uniref:substrate-binding domain-containing protein n=1 Tax=Mesorhizobium sp. KR9-304 TaxID=3156614 RepID=UPI0032B4FCCE